MSRGPFFLSALAGAAGLLWLAGCSQDAFSGGADQGGGTGADGGIACRAGETRCEVNRFLRCEGGIYQTVAVCGSDKACSTTLGCVDCDPGLGRGCKGNEVRSCGADGSFGPLVETCITDVCQNGSCSKASCSPESQPIYLVDNDHRLLRFNPAQGGSDFTVLATLDCKPGPSLEDFGPATPYSMSVDRTGQAWVLYTSGEIFWVKAASASTCQPSSFKKQQQGFDLFGMGFVSDAPGSNKEKLYVAGSGVLDLGSGNLGTIDPQTLQVTKLGALEAADQTPELTGTGNAELFGYVPGTSNTYVAQIDKQTAKNLKKWPLPPLEGSVTAWAFAHWGGKFYLFVTVSVDFLTEESRVLRLDPQTGKVETLVSRSPYRVVGAGVSTCAPTIE
jgi:hypothetical protein